MRTSRSRDSDRMGRRPDRCHRFRPRRVGCICGMARRISEARDGCRTRSRRHRDGPRGLEACEKQRRLASLRVNACTGWSICIRFRARLVIQRIAQPSDRDHAECAKVGAQRTSETTVTAPIFKRSVVGCPERHPKTSKPSRRCLRHAMSPFGAVAPWIVRRSFQITHRDVRMALRNSRSSRPVEIGANSAHGNTRDRRSARTRLSLTRTVCTIRRTSTIVSFLDTRER